MSEENAMSQGFNDSELEDIMQEIETLESEAVGETKVSSTDSSENNVVAKRESQTLLEENSMAPEGKNEGENFEEFQNQFSEEFSGANGNKNSVPGEIMQVGRVEVVSKTKLQEVIENEMQKISHSVDQTAMMQPDSASPTPQSVKKMKGAIGEKAEMSFQLTGDVEFRLELIVDDEKVKLFIDKSKNFIITFEGGAHFQIPLKKALV